MAENEQEITESQENFSGDNIYGRHRFTPERAKEHVEGLINDFQEYYSSRGYREEPSVKISSGIDPTVRFIGSHISVFKPYLAQDTVPNPGLYMRQNCLRTRNAGRLLDDEFSPAWGSFFTSIGALSAPDRLDAATAESLSFFENQLGIDRQHILLRINSQDQDLMEAVRRYYPEDQLEVDSRPPQYYQHDIGMEGISGRNFNIALRNPSGEGFSDVGNVIVLESPQKPLGIEIALGTSTILKQLYSLEHVQDCAPVIGLRAPNEAIRRKFEDAITTSTVLYEEGLRPLGNNNRNRILKQYVRALSYFRAKSDMRFAELTQIMTEFEQRQFEPSETTAPIIAEFVQAYERDLLSREDLTEDEQKIKAALESSGVLNG